jgi:modulator of FtsH protease HflK
MSLNDPRWGNQGNDDKNERDGQNPRGQNQGPPDLEEVWRDFNQKLSGLFGGRGPRPSRPSGNGSPPPPRSPLSFRQLGGGFGVLIVLLLVVWMASGFYTVDANQRGVVLRFGKFIQTTEPGLRWRLPSPIESHEIVDLSGVRTVEVGYRGSERNKVLRESLMLTDDENITSIQFAVQYVLNHPENYLFNNRVPDEAVGQVAETAMREIVGKNPMDFVLYEGREEIAATAHRMMQGMLDRYATGIQVSRVTMQNAQPPEQVQAAFDDAVKAGQDRERQKNEGEAYANDVVPRARGAAARLIEEANGYKERVIANAEGEASRFTLIQNEYSLAPRITRERLYLETMQQVLGASSKVLIDAKGNGNLLFLPLDKLVQQASGTPPALLENPSDSGNPPQNASPSAPTRGELMDPRSRDFFRGRDLGMGVR